MLYEVITLEEEGSRLDEVLLVPRPGVEDLAAGLIRHVQLEPALDDVQRTGREVVPDLVVGDVERDGHRLSYNFV